MFTETVEEPCFHQTQQGTISLPVSRRAENKELPLLQQSHGCSLAHTRSNLRDVHANVALKHSYREERGYWSLRMT